MNPTIRAFSNLAPLSSFFIIEALQHSCKQTVYRPSMGGTPSTTQIIFITLSPSCNKKHRSFLKYQVSEAVSHTEILIVLLFFLLCHEWYIRMGHVISWYSALLSHVTIIGSGFPVNFYHSIDSFSRYLGFWLHRRFHLKDVNPQLGRYQYASANIRAMQYWLYGISRYLSRALLNY